MTKSTRPNNAAVVDTCTARLNALNAYVKNTKAVIAINGVPHKAAEVLAIYQSCLDTRATLKTQRAQVKATLVSRATAESNRQAADRALKPWVINQYGADSQEAHDFGFPPPKVPVRSADDKAEAVALGQATRKARHTMGPKQKEEIRGTLVPTAPAAPAITVQAAPPAASTLNTTTTTTNAALAAPAPAASPLNGASPQH